MAKGHRHTSAVAVAGGLIVARGVTALRDRLEHFEEGEELYDEASGRWFELPQHAMSMAQSRRSTALTSVPVAALAVAEYLN